MQNLKRSGILLVLTLVAFALYVFQMDSQSLRGDEAFDAMFITGPIPSMLEQMRSTQPYPPLYHLALKGWTAVAGRSTFALRFLSALCTVLVVPLAYQLGRLWFGRRAGLFAALLATFHPLLLWYAQDRMYASLAALTLASTVLATLLWQGHSGRFLWYGYAIVTLLSLYEHYAAVFILLAQNLTVLVWSWRARGKRWLTAWIGIQFVIGLAFLPWIVFAWPVLSSHTSAWTQPVTLPDMLRRLFQAYSVGLTISPEQAIIPLVGFGIAAGRGLIARGEHPDRPARLMALIVIIIPVTAVYLLSLSRPMFDERYLVMIIVPYLALLGRGLAGTRRWVPIGLAGFMLAGMIVADLNYRFDPAFAKAPGWNTAFAFLQAQARPTDAIVYTFPDPAPEYYAQNRWVVFLLPPEAPPDPDRTRQIAREIAETHPRIWLIPQWSRVWDQDRLAEQTLDAMAERAAEFRAGRLPLVLYHTRQLYEAERTALDVTLGGRARLIGATVRQPDGSAVQHLIAHPGDPIRVTLYWQAEQLMETNYSVFVHLLNEAGQIQSQHDSWPRGGAYPTSWWEPGAVVVDTVVLALDPDTPAGTYRLVTGMYDSTGTRLPVTGADADAPNARAALPATVEVQVPCSYPCNP